MINPQCIQQLINFAEDKQLFQQHQTIIIGLSGGPDSIFLLHFLLQIKERYNLQLIAAHLDHQWRPESARDARFCKEIAERCGIKFITARASEIKLSKKVSGSKEEEGRILRRTFFEQIAKQYNPIAIALAHHANDQQETFFIRLLRGSGLRGLTGIKPKDGIYIHPLLCCNKQEIVKELEKNNITFLVDPTNQNDQFLRNRIRLHIIPALRQCDARFDESLTRIMHNLQEADDFLQQEIKKIFNELSELKDHQILLNYNKLLTLHPFLQKQLLLHWFIHKKVSFTPSSSFFEEVLRFLKNTKSKEHTFYQSWKIIKKKSYISLISE